MSDRATTLKIIEDALAYYVRNVSTLSSEDTDKIWAAHYELRKLLTEPTGAEAPKGGATEEAAQPEAAPPPKAEEPPPRGKQSKAYKEQLLARVNSLRAEGVNLNLIYQHCGKHPTPTEVDKMLSRELVPFECWRGLAAALDALEQERAHG